MPSPRFLQIHTLTSYPAALLNRDDVGLAKRLPFGGATRTRISSQCLKRHWRTFEGEHALRHIRVDDNTAPMSVRSRLSFDRYLKQPLISAGVAEPIAQAVAEQLMNKVLGKNTAKAEKTEKKKKGANDAAVEATVAANGSTMTTLESGQVTVLGHPELRYLLQEAQAICQQVNDAKEASKAVDAHFTKEREKNLSALRLGAGLDAALFGRMVTSDILARCDAAVHVAHAFTVHAEETETDYFTAVDDLTRGDGQLGSGHLGTTELTSGLFYSYVVVDLPLLVANLQGCALNAWESADRSLAGEVLRSLVHVIATVSPGAKLGSTAPHAYAHLALLEAGNRQPRSLANAFLRPVRVTESSDLLDHTYGALSDHLHDLDAMYGRDTSRRLAALGSKTSLTSIGAEFGSLAEVADWAASIARGES